jgi:hypothetical protein
MMTNLVPDTKFAIFRKKYRGSKLLNLFPSQDRRFACLFYYKS